MWGLFDVHINLETRCMIEAMLEDMSLTADKIISFYEFNKIVSNHVTLHALVNWGVIMKLKSEKNHSFVARSSLIMMIMYNYFSYTCFDVFFQRKNKLGFLTDDCSPIWNTCVNTGIKEGIVAHNNICDLQKSCNSRLRWWLRWK